MVVVQTTEKRFMKLQGDLEAMGYSEPLGIESVPLVERLFADLVATTQSYENLSGNTKKLSDNLSLTNNSMYPLKKENNRLVKENNKLHLELIRKSEEHDIQTRKWKEELGKFQQALKDKEFQDAFREQNLAKCEREIAALRQRCSHLLQRSLVAVESEAPFAAGGKNGGSIKAGGISMQKQSFQLNRTLDRSRGNESLSSHRGNNDSTNTSNITRESYGVSFNKVSSSGVKDHMFLNTLEKSEMASNLNAQVSNMEEQVADLNNEVAALRAGIAARDKEINRLGGLVQIEADSDRSNLDHINKTNGQIVAQLNGQVDFLTSQLAEQEKIIRTNGDSKKHYDDEIASLKLKLKEQVDISKRLVGELKDAENKLRTLHEIQRAETARGAAANEMAANEVSNIKERLRVASETLRSKEQAVSFAEEERERLARVVQSYGSDKQKYMEAVEKLQFEKEKVAAENEKLHRDMASLARQVEDARRDAGHLESKVEALQTEIEILQNTVTQLQRHKDDDSKVITDYSREVNQSEEMNKVLAKDNILLKAEVQKLLAENNALHAAADSLREERGDLSTKLHQDQSSRRQELMAVKALENESGNLKREVAVLSSQVSEQRRIALDLTKRLNAAEGDRDGALLRVRSLESESSELEVALNNERKRSTELQETMLHLQNLESLPTLVQQLQENNVKLRSESARFELQAANARRDAERLGTTISELSAKLSFLNDAWSSEQIKNKHHVIEIQELQFQTDELSGQLRSLRADRDALKSDLSHALSERESTSLSVIESRRNISEISEALQVGQMKIAELEKQVATREAEKAATHNLNIQLNNQLAKERAHINDVMREQAEHQIALSNYERQVNDLKLKIAQSSHTVELSNVRASDSEAAKASLESQLAGSEAQVRQLRSLFNQLERTREEMTSQIQKNYERISQLEVNEQGLRSDIYAKDNTIADLKTHCDHLSHTITTLDEERDNLQREVDEKTVHINELHSNMKTVESHDQSLHLTLDSLQKQVQSQSEALGARDREIRLLHANLDTIRRDFDELRHHKELCQNEIASLTADLSTMTRETQSIHSENNALRTQVFTAKQQYEGAAVRAASAEQQVASLSVEKEDLLATYRAVCAERARLDKHVANLALQRSSTEVNLEQSSVEITRLKNTIEALDATNNRYLTDLKTYERQTAELSRQLAATTTEVEALRAHAASLSSDISSTRIMTNELNLQDRELRLNTAAKTAEVDLLKQRLLDSETIAGGLRSQLQIERQNVRELENLIARMRSEAATDTSFGRISVASDAGKGLSEASLGSSTKTGDGLTKRIRGGDLSSTTSLSTSNRLTATASSSVSSSERHSPRSPSSVSDGPSSLEKIISENEKLRAQLKSAMTNSMSPSDSAGKSRYYPL